MKIAFLLDNAYGIGGTIRSTVNLSRALAARHTVEVVSLRRPVPAPTLPFDARVTLTPLIDLRHDSAVHDGEDPLFHQPSRRFTERRDHFERGIATRLGDVRMEAYLRDTDADVVIATRPKLNDYLAHYGSDRYLRIGQEHLTHGMHRKHVRTHQDAAIPQLDAFLTVSYADAADYRAALPGAEAAGTLVTCIPNSVPATDVEPSQGDSRMIVAAGRLVGVKRYDRLLKAFALVTGEHPDWRLRVYGRGRKQAELRAQIDSLGLYDRAFLMGPRSPMDPEWAKGAIAAVSSDAESFGMTLVEAMHCGVPVVSTDCPYGPGEIVTHGTDGLLTPLSDESSSVRAYADALLQLIEEPALRQRMGQAARERAQQYAPDRIAEQYEQLFGTLLDSRPGKSRPGTTGVADPDAAQVPPAAQAAPTEPTGRTPAGKAGMTAPTAEPSSTARTTPAPEGSSADSRPTSPEADASPGTPPGGAQPGTRSAARPTAIHRLALRALHRALRRLTGPVLRPVPHVLRRLRPQQPPRGRGSAPHSPPKTPRPRARTRVAADGTVALRLRAARLPNGPAVLVLRARHHEHTEDVRLPLPDRSEAVDGWVHVRLDRSAHHLEEARWDTYVERASDGRRKRVRSELVETARLLAVPPPVDEDGVLTPWVPYTTSDGYLAVRAWRRAGHAEVTSVGLGRRGFTVGADLYGEAARPAMLEALRHGGARVTAVPRREAGHGFEMAVTVPAPDAPEPSAGSIAFELPYDLPAALDPGGKDSVWELRIQQRDGTEAGAVRFGRLLGDLADRKKTDIVPTARLADSTTGVRLYFTLNNDLALSLQPLPRDERSEDAAEQSASDRTAPGEDADAGPRAHHQDQEQGRMRPLP